VGIVTWRFIRQNGASIYQLFIRKAIKELR